MRLFNEFNTVIAEITCTAEQAHEPWNPVDKIIEFFNRENLRFAVEECLVSKKEILKHPHWKDWRESRVEDIPDEVTVFIFLSSKKTSPTSTGFFSNGLKTMKDCLSTAGNVYPRLTLPLPAQYDLVLTHRKL